MAKKYLQLVLTPAVQRAQEKYFGKHKVVENAPETDALTTDEAGFIASRDSFYVATVSETGWPYVQFRGGPPGFLLREPPAAQDPGARPGDRSGRGPGARRPARSTGGSGVVERAILVHVEAFDWNCPQHIEPRWSRSELEALGLRAPE